MRQSHHALESLADVTIWHRRRCATGTHQRCRQPARKLTGRMPQTLSNAWPRCTVTKCSLATTECWSVRVKIIRNHITMFEAMNDDSRGNLPASYEDFSFQQEPTLALLQRFGRLLFQNSPSIVVQPRDDRFTLDFVECFPFVS